MTKKNQNNELMQKKIQASLLCGLSDCEKRVKAQSEFIERLDCVRELLEMCASKLLQSVSDIAVKHKEDTEYIARSLVFYKGVLWEIKEFYEKKLSQEIGAINSARLNVEKGIKKIEKTKERKK